MTRWIVLLRGVNVGGNHRLQMAPARAGLEEAGFTNVVSYIQSGNFVLDSAAGQDEVRDLVRRTLEPLGGFEIPTVVLDDRTLREIIAANPFSPSDPRLEHIFFHDGPVPHDKRAALERLAAEVPSDSQLAVIGRAIYLHTPEGFSKSTLVAKWSRTTPTGTGRNLATVTKLAELTAAPH